MNQVSGVRRLVLTLLLVVAPAVQAIAGNPFDVGSKSADWAVVTVTDSLPSDPASSPMLDQLRGVLARLDKSQITELRAAGGSTATPVITPDSADRLCIVHVGKGAEVKHVEVLIDFDGTYLAQELLPPGTTGPVLVKPRATKLAQAKFAKLVASWPAYRGNFTEPKDSPKPGTAAMLARPYRPGWYTFDQALMAERINGGQHTSLEIHQRDLSTEPLHIRVPKNYDPKVPCGVLVYIDPGEKGGIYPNFCPAADELGFIIVAAENTGNSVYREIRYQLALDGLANVAERYLIDPRRVYAMGISGGGQISTHLWLCFPDIFTGAIPMVALASYENIPATPGKMWAATLKKPVPKLLKLALPHRCGAMTGAQDFNQKIIGDAAKLLVRDGFDVRVYDYPDMGHQAPKAERFTDALKWVDEPYHTMREKEVKAADDALAKINADLSLSAEARKKALVEVTKIGSWTLAAWRAAELLGVKPTSSP